MINNSYIFINCGDIKKKLSHDDIGDFFTFENRNNKILYNIDLTFYTMFIKAIQIDLNNMLIIDKKNGLKVLNLKEIFIWNM